MDLPCLERIMEMCIKKTELWPFNVILEVHFVEKIT